MLTFDLSKIQLPDHGLMLDLGCGEGACICGHGDFQIFNV